MDIFSNDKIKWEKQVREFEKEYLSLTKLEQIPIYEIHFIKPTNDISYSMQIINSSKPYILNVNMGFMYLTDFDYKETLVHEFTHMIDYSTLLLDKDEKFRKNVLSLYSEFHATYEQCKYIAQTKKSIDGKIIYFCNLLNESIIEYNNNQTIRNWKAIEEAYMYYYGAIIAFNESSINKYAPQIFDCELDWSMHSFYDMINMNLPFDLIADFLNKIKKLSDTIIIAKTLDKGDY